MNVLFFKKLAEAGDEGGGGGAGTGGADNGGTGADNGGASDNNAGGGAGDDTGGGSGTGAGGADDNGGNGGGGDLNALGAALDGGKGDAGKGGKGEGNDDKGGKGDDGAAGKGDEGAAGKGASDDDYKAALKLDEKTFGKDITFDERYLEKMPELFRKHGLDPQKANALANDFAALQRSVDEEAVKKQQAYQAWRTDEMRKLNESFLENYDKPARETIGRAIDKFFKPGTPMFEMVRRTEVGVDPGFLEAMFFIGERLPKDDAAGAAAGAGSGSGKSIADAFMGR